LLSIRTPSSYQSLVAIRPPTRGLVSLDGIIPFTLSRDGIGPMARNVTDAATTVGMRWRKRRTISRSNTPEILIDGEARTRVF
jgi:Asp-tRNA(Asn)/Glu-tRNA(Gln) amidotransferase A subunit family amidase